MQTTGLCTQPIRGIVLCFYGLGSTEMAAESESGKYYASQGILYIEPYNNPWAWMNRQAVAYTDEILDVLFEHYGLPEGLPIVSTGGSMGGLSALVYCRYAKRTPAACIANCPVCDLPYHFTERPDLPGTLYSAFFGYDMPLAEAMKTASPLHLVSEMPKIPYRIFHCGEDRAVNLERHSERFVQEMGKNGFDIRLTICPDRGHCDLTPELWKRYRQDVLDAIAVNEQ